MSRYKKISVRMYADSRFIGLSRPQPNAQYLWIYLLTGPHTTSVPGLFAAGEAALSEALDWPLKGFQKAFQELFGKGMAKADWKARVVWIPNAFKYNVPESPNVVKSWSGLLSEIPECSLKTEAIKQLKAYIEGMGKGFQDAFEKAYSKAMPNQEQEKESMGRAPDASASKRLVPPSVEEVAAYCAERKNSIDPAYFVDYYSARGWNLKGSPMKDWQGCIRTWEKNDKDSKNGSSARPNSAVFGQSTGPDVGKL